MQTRVDGCFWGEIVEFLRSHFRLWGVYYGKNRQWIVLVPFKLFFEGCLWKDPIIPPDQVSNGMVQRERVCVICYCNCILSKYCLNLSESSISWKTVLRVTTVRNSAWADNLIHVPRNQHYSLKDTLMHDLKCWYKFEIAIQLMIIKEVLIMC